LQSKKCAKKNEKMLLKLCQIRNFSEIGIADAAMGGLAKKIITG
jgi:hypothetical protein